MTNLSLTERAVRLALEAHAGQVRKTDGSPYIVHPIMVARLLVQHGFSEEVVAGGLTHDVLEDTNVNADTLRAELGDVVLAIVIGVTEDKSLVWEERKKAYAHGVKYGPESVKAVSIADKIHNMESMLVGLHTEGPNLWNKFSRGKDAQLWFAHLMEESYAYEWKHPLVDAYRALVSELEAL